MCVCVYSPPKAWESEERPEHSFTHSFGTETTWVRWDRGGRAGRADDAIQRVVVVVVVRVRRVRDEGVGCS